MYTILMLIYGLWALWEDAPGYAIAAGLFAIAMRM